MPAAVTSAVETSPTPAVSHRMGADDYSAIVKRYCATCHNERNKQPHGELTLTDFDVAQAPQHVETAEKMIRKLRAGLMPPPRASRPAPDVLDGLVGYLETSIDTGAAARPNPGNRSFQRLNRAEYEMAIFNLLDLDVSAGDWLPNDTLSANFDNIADAQALSPTLLDSYLNAAAAVSRMAVGDRNASTLDTTYTAPNFDSQHPWDHVEGTPYGTRGGIVADHVFPADGEYVLEATVSSGSGARFEDVDVSIDGERVGLLAYEVAPSGGADDRRFDPVDTPRIFVRAGQHRVTAAWVRRTDGPYEDLIRPHDWSQAGGPSGGPGITTLPHVRTLVIKGPYKITGISETPSRAKIFSCRPTTQAEERPCAEQILTRLGTQAYRRPMTKEEVDRLMPLYEAGARADGFEGGVRTALEALLASPFFIFRLEQAPDTVRASATGTYRVADLDIASRLSFFLWGAPPDRELLDLATRGRLSAPGVLEKQARRMLADPRADALGRRFAYQWLRLQDVSKLHPDVVAYPNFDLELAADMIEETERFFNDAVRENRSFLDLLTADYTFVNERLARHYGIPGVAGEEFRKVTYPDARRRGLLGQGSILVQTSLATRTSPVLRGKWVMEVLMGTPPPPPPPNVPALEQTAGTKDGKQLTTRERMEMHRANPTCNACHRFMDPIGLSLDNFDATGRWREREFGSPLDTRGDFYDGTSITSPSELTAALLKRPIPLVRTFTENLMAYAVGRRMEVADQPAIRAIAASAAKDGYTLSSFILGVVNSGAFRLRKVQPVSTTEDTGAVARR
ncbi:MAG: DUF1592 domain-containing protein [Acidobacteria bacterium]|nr:DUF1592 domain-containing protein [Acidobacteriota bacterium]